MEWSMRLLDVAIAPGERILDLAQTASVEKEDAWDAKRRSNVVEASRRKPCMFLDDSSGGGRRSRAVVSLARLRETSGVGSQSRGKGLKFMIGSYRSKDLQLHNNPREFFCTFSVKCNYAHNGRAILFLCLPKIGKAYSLLSTFSQGLLLCSALGLLRRITSLLGEEKKTMKMESIS